MDVLIFLWDYLVPFLVVLTVLVFVHELGHYWVARRNGVRVEVFSVGFGPEIWGRTDRLGTRWRVSVVPIGGYVKFFGDMPEEGSVVAALEALEPADRAVAFHGKTVGQRAAIVAAGPAANFLFAFVLLVGLYSTVGIPDTPAEVGSVVEDSAAAEAGFRPGDRILRINDTDIGRFEEMRSIIAMSAGERLEITVLRDGTELVLTVMPRLTEVEDPFGNKQKIGRLGIARQIGEYRRLDPFTASWEAASQIGTVVEVTMGAIGQIIVGSRSSSELGGPVRIAQMSGKIAESGVVALIGFMVMLSINLGLINLFPIPVLDGGHLLFYAIEWVRGRPVTERVQDFSFRIGLAVVLALMVFATWNDLIQIEFFQFIAQLFS